MKKIILLCAGGFSTSLLMNKMKDAAEKIDYDCEISAHSVSMASAVAKNADIILIGPQVRYVENVVRKSCSNALVEVIDMHDYGRMDGKAVLLFAKNKMEQ